MRIWPGPTVAALLALAGCGPEAEAEAGLTLGVVPKGTTHEFWKAVHAGAQDGAADAAATVLWQGPSREDDREGQVKVVEDLVSRRVDGIVLAPLDETALGPVVREAQAEGIPVVIIDSALSGVPVVSFVATDNYQGGALGARRLGELMGGRGRALLLRYAEGSASTTKREQGFLDTLAAEFPGVRVVSSNQYGGATTETAYQAAENLLVRFPELDGVFCPNESTTMGMLRALQDAGRAGSVGFVGFDASQKLVDGLRAGEIHGLVLQDPFAMGRLGVRAMLRHLRGEKVEPRIDTGLHLATRDNLNAPEIEALLARATR